MSTQRKVKMGVEEPELGYIELFFDNSSTHYIEDHEVNAMFVHAVTEHMRQMHQVCGIVFLNDFISSLGLPRIAAGQTSGWAVTKPDIVTHDFGENIRITCWVERDMHFALDD